MRDHTNPRYEFSVRVKPQYLPSQSNPAQEEYVFAYTITITNTGTIGAQLLSRHWIITDANAHIEEVRGPGVVGYQPFLEPGQSFEYTSGCPLRTAHGSMKGTYFCVAQDGTQFTAAIAEFFLVAPGSMH